MRARVARNGAQRRASGRPAKLSPVKRIRERIWEVGYAELGEPFERGYYPVADLGEVLIDQADVRYIELMKREGYEPRFFVSPSPALGDAYVVVSRMQKAD